MSSQQYTTAETVAQAPRTLVPKNLERPHLPTLQCSKRLSSEEGAKCEARDENLKVCSKPAWMHIIDSQPSYCRRHEYLFRYRNKYERCFGADNGIRCGTWIRWVPPFFQFCPQHEYQAANMPCVLPRANQDVMSMVIDLLTETDRLCFALASRRCAEFVRTWGSYRTPSNTPRYRIYVSETFNGRGFCYMINEHGQLRLWANFGFDHPGEQESSLDAAKELPKDLTNRRRMCLVPHNINHIKTYTVEISLLKLDDLPWTLLMHDFLGLNRRKRTYNCLMCGGPCPLQEFSPEERYFHNDSLKARFLCQDCRQLSAEPSISWCHICEGTRWPTPYAIAKAIWSAQPRSEPLPKTLRERIRTLLFSKGH